MIYWSNMTDLDVWGFTTWSFKSTGNCISSATVRGQVSRHYGTKFTFTIMWWAGFTSLLLKPHPPPFHHVKFMHVCRHAISTEVTVSRFWLHLQWDNISRYMDTGIEKWNTSLRICFVICAKTRGLEVQVEIYLSSCASVIRNRIKCDIYKATVSFHSCINTR